MKFLINEEQSWFLSEQQLGLGFDEKPDYINSLCKKSKNPESPSCQLRQMRPLFTDELIDILNESFAVLYNFFGWKNAGILPKIIELSLETPEKTVYSIKTVADFILDKDFNDDVTKKQLKQLKDYDTLPDDFDSLIRQAREKEYTKYENDFISDDSPFKENRTSLSLNYKCGNQIDLKFLDIVERFKGLSKGQFKKYLKDIKNCISDSLDFNQAVKSDIISKSPLYIEEDGEKKQVFPSGAVFEIKKMDTNIDSYLSEFFSVFKQSVNAVYKPTHLQVYNAVIQGIYDWIRRRGNDYLERVKSNMDGLIFDNYTIIPIEYIELYWSNVGQRGCKERRLSIRFRIKPEYRGKVVPGYLYVKNSDILKKIDVHVSDKDVTYRVC